MARSHCMYEIKHFVILLLSALCMYILTFCDICMQSRFDIPFECAKSKKAWLKRAGRAWKDFKSDLANTYIYGDGDKEGNKTPVGVYPAIDEDTWQKFFKIRTQNPDCLVSSNLNS